MDVPAKPQVEVVSRAAWEPATTADLDAFLKDIADQEALVASQITAAREWLENVGQWRAIVDCTLAAYLDEFPECEDAAIVLPRPKLRSVEEITYIDADGQEQTLDAGDYWVDTVAQPGRVLLAQSAAWPATQAGRPNSVRIEYVAGYATAAEVPRTTVQALCKLVTHWFTHRGTAIAGLSLTELPLGLQALIAADSAKRGQVV